MLTLALLLMFSIQRITKAFPSTTHCHVNANFHPRFPGIKSKIPILCFMKWRHWIHIDSVSPFAEAFPQLRVTGDAGANRSRKSYF